MIAEFRLPDVGEGLTEADIVSWHVKPGDQVETNQVIVEIETAKAVVELPSPWDGVVSKLLAAEGQTVDVGTPIIAVELVGDEAAASAAAEPDGAAERDDAPPPNAVLVGYGVKPSATTRRQRKQPAKDGAGTAAPADRVAEAPAPAAPAPTAPAAPPQAQAAPSAPSQAPAPAAPSPDPAPAPAGIRAQVLAKPPVRKLARDLGIDLTALAGNGTGPHGTVTREDVRKLAETGAPARSFTSAASAADERIPIKGVRKHTAAAMVNSAFTAPHVTEFLQIDITETMAAVRRLRDLPDFAEMRPSPLLFVARALLTAVARHPMINASWDEAAQEIVVKHQVNLGIAVATERGLIVPNVKDAGSMSTPDLARSLAELAKTARDGKATPADLSGGTITITNVGVFGVDAGTPILTPGEAGILAFGQVRDAPWVHEGQLAIRKVTTLSLSFDHRIVDGELGSAVLRDVGSMLTDPVRLLAWS